MKSSKIKLKKNPNFKPKKENLPAIKRNVTNQETSMARSSTSTTTTTTPTISTSWRRRRTSTSTTVSSPRRTVIRRTVSPHHLPNKQKNEFLNARSSNSSKEKLVSWRNSKEIRVNDRKIGEFSKEKLRNLPATELLGHLRVAERR